MNRKLASLALAFLFLVTPASAWSLKEAHTQANTTLVQVGDWCSGTIIDKKQGLIVTAAHCTEPAKVTDNIIIIRPNGDGRTLTHTYFKPIEVTVWNFDDEGNVTGSQKYMTNVLKAVYPQDVAILQSLSPSKFSGQAIIGLVPVKYGDKVFSVGNPLMQVGTVAEGYVTKPRMPFTSSYGLVVTIMHTSFTAPGSSGGGLFNDFGMLVGITNWGVAGGPSLASPVSNVLELLKSLELTVG